MDPLDAIFEPALKDGLFAGVSLLAQDVKGAININRSYGVSRLQDQQAMGDDVPMRVASASKLLTSIMALQCVERGEVSLDQSLEDLLPEVAELQVITGFDDKGNPEQRPPKTPVTLRHLLTHSSGLEYAIMNPLLRQFRKGQGLEIEQEYDNLDDNFKYPLTFDPGSSWAYGPSLDWTTRLIARASGQGAETYLRGHLIEPLDLEPWELTFNLQEHPGAHARHADTFQRNPDGSLGVDETVKYWNTVEEPSGGQGIFCTTRAFMKVLHSILIDDGKLLKPETRRMLLEPSLTSDAEKGLNAFFVQWKEQSIGEPVPTETPKSYSLGGLLVMEHCDPQNPESFRQKGSMSWAGVTNFFWNIDPNAEVCTLWAFHLKPFGDEICGQLGKKFERVVYEMARANN